MCVCVVAFVFCALLEFTFVNYMWRKQPFLVCSRKRRQAQQQTSSSEAVNGKDILGNNQPQDADDNMGAVAVPLVRQNKETSNKL